MDNKSKKKKWLPWVIALAVIASAGVYWNYQRTLAAKKPVYITYTLKQRDPLVLKGTAEVTEYTSVRPNAARGEIDVISVVSGQKVKIGDVLFTYKNKQAGESVSDAQRQADKAAKSVSDAEAELSQAKSDQKSDRKSLDTAKANLSASKSRLRTAQKALTQAQTDRNADEIEKQNDRILKENDNIQQYSQDVSRYQAKTDSWVNQIRQLEKALEQAKTVETDAKLMLERAKGNQADLKETAGIDGIAAVHEENKNNPSASLVDILSEVSEIKATVTEYDYFRIRPQQNINLTVVPTRETMPGVIKSVEALPEINQNLSAPTGVSSVNYVFKVAPARPIQPGYSVEIQVELNEVVVPAGAILTEDGKTYLWAYKDGAVSKRLVTLVQKGTYWTLTGGLEKGEVIIQNPDSNLTEGGSVKVMAS